MKASSTNNAKNEISHWLYYENSCCNIYYATKRKGKLNIEDNVNKYIPSFPADKNITLRNLLTHTSGLPEQGQGSVDAASRLKLVTWIGAQTLQFPAGTGWKYTDYNYMVLVYCRKISNKPLAEYVKENILNPVEMHESGMGATLPEDIFLAEGYTKKIIS